MMPPPTSLVRSSLEVMLDSLRRRDEDEKPKDLPPSLPVRPPSKARLPSARRSLAINFKVDNSVKPEFAPNAVHEKEEVKRKTDASKELGINGSTFGCKKKKTEVQGESPYVLSTVENGLESDWEDNIDYFIKKKLNVWCRHDSGQWDSGKIQSTSGEEALVLLSEGHVVKACTRNLLPANPDVLVGVDDLIQLSYLNEPSILHNLQCRYSQDLIYSKAGPVLIAINPFKDVQIYGNDVVTVYRQKLVDTSHVYATADTAYDKMIRDGKNQSIILSGESGAGKSETAKWVMQYLVAVRGSSGIGNVLIQASRILEVFGNAKTSKNDNSSRFGKLIEVHFSSTGEICGATIQTSLLEKSRVVQLINGERSYHVFYQLCSGAPTVLKGKLNLKMASEYNYLNQSDCVTVNGIDDAQKFHTLMEALDAVQICKEDQEHVFVMLAAVLWLGNILFQVTSDENHVEVVEGEAVATVSSLMGCSVQNLMQALSTHNTTQAGKESIVKKLTLQQAIDRRDALAKHLYACLFEWLVEKINKSLRISENCTGKSISILDICGFQSFQKNGYEQFCINYANERLQQHFNRLLFKLQQEEYEAEGIDWSKIDYVDNQECLNLFEKKPIGLLSLLNEESNSLKATNKLKQHLSTNPCFKEGKDGDFIIQHYAGEVLYHTNGFLEKNKDLMLYDFTQLLSSCNFSLSDSPNQCLVTKFKEQVFKMMQHLENTTPHFIICIKPNSEKLHGIFEKDLVLQQIRCCGVLDAIRISRLGYPTQITHQEFSLRYGFLLGENDVSRDPLSISAAVLQKFNISPDMYQVGYTKLYFRSGQSEALEDIRNKVLQGALEVQDCFHGRRNFHDLKSAVITLQSLVRGFLARKNFDYVRNENKMKPSRNSSDLKGVLENNDEAPPSVLAELQMQVMKAEASLEKKEKENTALREKLQQFETRYSENNAKMKSIEDSWQKQIGSLQMTMNVAKKSLFADDFQSPSCYDSEDTTSIGARTGASTPPMFSNSDNGVGTGRRHNGNFNEINHLVREFEQQKQNFDDDAKILTEVKSSQSADEDLRKLKMRFEAWKKDYKERLREAKAKSHKIGNAETGRWKLWGKKTTKTT